VSAADLHDPGGKTRYPVSAEVMGSAEFSPCGRYRYRLERWLREGATGRPVLFVLMNPSTAAADVDDLTVRLCWGYARRWGFSRMIVTNTMAYRATHPEMLLALGDPIPAGLQAGGADNINAVLKAAKEAGEIVCAWGSVHRRLRPYVERVEFALRGVGYPLSVLALTKAGEPHHPRGLLADLSPKPWTRTAPRHA
jgi:hypothetical protein